MDGRVIAGSKGAHSCEYHVEYKMCGRTRDLRVRGEGEDEHEDGREYADKRTRSYCTQDVLSSIIITSTIFNSTRWHIQQTHSVERDCYDTAPYRRVPQACVVKAA